MTIAEIYQIAIDNEQNPKFREFYEESYKKLTVEQASQPAGEGLEEWAMKYYRRAMMRKQGMLNGK